jgi:serine/threonine-protein kinase
VSNALGVEINKDRWEAVQRVFYDALEHPPGARREFVETACAGDALLLESVIALVEQDARDAGLLDNPSSVMAAILKGAILQGEGEPEVPPNWFGPYQLRRFVGEGGMGVVYLAERPDLGSFAAIKILRDAWMSPSRRVRFANEQRTLARLNHPGIARLYDANVLADGTPWFAMEYVEGSALTAYCCERNCGLRDRLLLFRAVCEAVQFAHSHAVIHRDLKPSNILVNRQGSVRLLDFGIARHLEQADETRTGLRLMTPAYAAPEVVRGEAAGIYSDVYSLGAILAELLQGVPIPGRSRAELDVLAAVAMHESAERRYGSVEGLIRDVDHFLKGEPLEARPDSLPYRIRKFVERNARAVLVSVAAAAAVMLLAVFFTVRLARARTAALDQAGHAERIEQFLLNVLDGGDREAGPSENLRVIDLLARGEREARALSNDRQAQADLFQTLGTVYQNLGHYEKADGLLSLALQEQSGDAAAGAQVSLGLLRADEAKLDEAERRVRNGFETLRAAHPPTDPRVMRSALALGKVLELRGEYKQGIALMAAMVIQEDRPGANPEDLADSRAELANHYFYAGDYAASDALNRQVLPVYRAIHGPTHPKVAEVLVNLGASQHDRGNYVEAETLHRQALAIYEQYYGPEHPETAASMTHVARALVFQKRYDEAESLLRRALKIREQAYGPMHPNVASTVNELGNVAVARDRYPEAEADFSRMIVIYKTVYHDRHYLIGIAESNLGSVYLAEKEYKRAEPLFRDAIDRYIDTQSAGHLNVGITRIKLGRTLLREGRLAEAEEQTNEGIRILSAQTSPSVSWLNNARKDLAELQRLKTAAGR